MADFNPFERKIAAFLSQFPVLKSKLKKTYQYLNYILHKPKSKSHSIFPFQRIGREEMSSFFGYYDKSPMDSSGKYILFHSIDKTVNKPDCQKSIHIDIYDVETKAVTKVAESKAYNWQQGARAQWINKDEFIFNDFDGKSFISKVVNIEKKENNRTYCFPVYDCYKDQFALSLNFDRLAQLRPDYGYFNLDDSTSVSDLENDGLFYLDLVSNDVQLILPLNKLVDSSTEDCTHKINHIMISPDGCKVMFLHRYFNTSGQRFDRLIVTDLSNPMDYTVLSDDGMVSHCFWKGNKQIVGYLRDEVLGDQYYLIDLSDCKKTILNSEKLNNFGDGHPHIHSNLMIFDTYPNKSRMKQLMLYNFNNQSLQKLGEFFESFEYYGETRCDLHPRMNVDGTKVFFDSVHDGRRYLYMMELD